MAELAAEEVDLRGDWIVQGDRSVVGNSTEQRIEWLIAQKLERIADDSSRFNACCNALARRERTERKLGCNEHVRNFAHTLGPGGVRRWMRVVRH